MKPGVGTVSPLLCRPACGPYCRFFLLYSGSPCPEPLMPVNKHLGGWLTGVLHPEEHKLFPSYVSYAGAPSHHRNMARSHKIGNITSNNPTNRGNGGQMQTVTLQNATCQNKKNQRGLNEAILKKGNTTSYAGLTLNMLLRFAGHGMVQAR
jgi:hypothetical protein